MGIIEHKSLDLREESDNTNVEIYDITSGWHVASQKLLGIGHIVGYI